MNDDVFSVSGLPAAMPFERGTVLVGKYRVERLLGQGGMGWVVEATHLQLDQRVALKFMNGSQAEARPEAVARFLKEARAAARIRSEHVARVSDVGTLDNGSPYLVMEFLEGQNLESRLDGVAELPIPEAIDLAIQACEGLAEAHAAGIVHRDLKPANLFLSRRSDGSAVVKLLDFGISKLTPRGSVPDAGITSTQTLMGSPLYMSPEQLRSSKGVDRRSDIWSMGIILYEMLTGCSPFAGETLPEVCSLVMSEPPSAMHALAPKVPAALEAVVLRCLEKDASRRFPDVGALALALAPFGEPEATLAADRVMRVVSAGDGAPISGAASRPRISIADRTPDSSATLNAAFGATDPPGPRRSPWTAVAVSVGAVLLGSGLTAGFMTWRAQGPAGGAGSVANGAALVQPASSATPVAAPATAAPGASSATAVETAPAPSAPASSAPVASPPAASEPANDVAPTAKPARKAKPAAAPSPKPGATSQAADPLRGVRPTSVFGGRD
jgi:serine/threonine-protein kinase